MEMRKPTLYLISLLMPAVAALAQSNLNESLYVEGEYVPDIVRQDKIHLLPQKKSFEIKKETPGYALGAVTSDYRSTIYALPALNLFTSRPASTSRGYLDLGMGQYLNCAASAGYRIVDQPNSEAGVWLQHNSTSLSRSRTNEFEPCQRRRMYDETIGAYLSRSLEKGHLDAALSYHLGYFNYYGLRNTLHEWSEYSYTKAPTQTLNNITISGQWVANINKSTSYHVGVNMDYFGYRRGLLSYNFTGTRETDLQLYAGATKVFRERGSIGVDLTANWLLYNDGDYGKLGRIPTYSAANYGNISLWPHYEWGSNGLKVRAGLEVDFTMNAGKLKGGSQYGEYATVHVAPDVKAEYAGHNVEAWVAVGGGTRLQTLASTSQLDYYQLPQLISTLPLWTPAEVSGGINLGPWSGLSATLRGKYAYTRNRRLGGWSMPAISDYYVHTHTLRAYDERNMNIKGFGLGMDLRYDYGHLLTATATLDYTPQNGTHGIFNGYDRPRWVLHTAFTVHPTESIDLGLAYQYRGVRSIYGYTNVLDMGPVLQQQRLQDICLLNFNADWRINERISVFGRINNILCRRVAILPQQPMEGLNFMVGAGLKF